MKIHLSRILSPALALVAAVPAAHANYLFDPTGGKVVFNSAVAHDDEVSSQSLGGTFKFFGQDKTSVYVSTNGNLNFSGTTAWSNVGLSSSSAIIAPFWDDLYIYQNSTSTITQKTSAGLYSATWDVVSNYDTAMPLYSFQVSLFSSAQTVGGFQFQAGDIAFSYDRIDSYVRNGNMTLGLSDGAGKIATPFGSDGLMTVGQLSQLPTGNRFILFRANASGGYDASIQTTSLSTVPGPAAVVPFLTGAVSCLRRRKRA